LVFCVVYFMVTVVVPLLFFHVIFEVRLPVSLLIGTVTDDVPPALSAVGVHRLHVVAVVPVCFAVLSVVVAAIFEHTTLAFSAADADWASGRANPVAAIAVAAQNAPTRSAGLIDSPPGRNDLFFTAEDSYGWRIRLVIMPFSFSAC
jgi:hypothetical protein